ncbi:MAG: carboxypeptidase regulatory-like domain-containing protein [Spirochaetales bacterium]|nr:carboxypeptidase regulatory-like domain-containing protein [Spirochaetales bacterium]
MEKDKDDIIIIKKGQKVRIRSGRKYIFQLERTYNIAFTLFTELGLDIWPGQNFILTVDGVTYEKSTDDNGEFLLEDVPAGEYLLKVGEIIFHIASIPDNDPPHPIHVPYDALPEIRDAWENPTDEELNNVD